VKILEFYEDIERTSRASDLRQSFETKHTVAASKTMANLAPVGENLMEIWLKQWNF